MKGKKHTKETRERESDHTCRRLEQEGNKAEGNNRFDDNSLLYILVTWETSQLSRGWSKTNAYSNTVHQGEESRKRDRKSDHTSRHFKQYNTQKGYRERSNATQLTITHVGDETGVPAVQRLVKSVRMLEHCTLRGSDTQRRQGGKSEITQAHILYEMAQHRIGRGLRHLMTTYYPSYW